MPGPWQKRTIHQYSITGQIDRDVANFKTEKAMFAALGKGPDMRNLGGSLVGDVASIRWPDGVTVVAGLGKDGHIHAKRWESGTWGAWKSVSTGKALGAPGFITWGSSEGHLYYTEPSGEVIELTTRNTGKTWA